MPENDRKLRVFICHALQDKSVVQGLYQRFLDEGWIEPWLPEASLLPGQDRGLKLDEVLKSTDLALVLQQLKVGRLHQNISSIVYPTVLSCSSTSSVSSIN